MITGIKNFFLELQTKDETAKRRWNFALTAAAMAIVIVVWISYLNLTNPQSSTEKLEHSSFSATAQNSLEIALRRGVETLKELKTALENLASQGNSTVITE